MKIMISGSSGLVGRYLIPALTCQHHEIIKMKRRQPNERSRSVSWRVEQGVVEAYKMEHKDALIHLAGDNIASGRWTKDKKQSIRYSRVAGTELISEALASLRYPPKVVICASAIGFYGNRGAEILDEDSPPGEGFLSEVCQEWEAATRPAEEAGIKVIKLRFGIVLCGLGGALDKMLFPFQCGLGGRLGSGSQYMSWISIQDAVRAIQFVLEQDVDGGPYNITAPNPVTNAEFTKTLAQTVKRPAFMHVPKFVLKRTLGEMAKEMLLTSIRAVPSRLSEAGFTFKHPHLSRALRSAVAISKVR